MWGVREGSQTVLSGHGNGATRLAVSDDEHYLAVVYGWDILKYKGLEDFLEQSNVKVWDLSTRQPVAHFRAKTQRIDALALGRHGEYLIIAEESWVSNVAQQRNTSPPSVLAGVHSIPSRSVRLSDLHKSVRVTEVWDLRHKPPKMTSNAVPTDMVSLYHRIEADENCASTLDRLRASSFPSCRSNSGRFEVTASLNGAYGGLTVRSRGDQDTSYYSPALDIEVTSSGTSIIVAGYKGISDSVSTMPPKVSQHEETAGPWIIETTVWDPLTSRERFTIECNLPVAVSPDGKEVLTKLGTSYAILDLRTNTCTGAIKDFGDQGVAIAISGNSSKLAISLPGSTIALCDIATKKRLLSLAGSIPKRRPRPWPLPSPGTYFRHLAINGTGSAIAAATGDDFVEVWSPSSSVDSWLLREHASITSLAFDPDNRHLGIGLASGEIALWDVQTRKRVRSIAAGPTAVSSLTFNKSGELLASIGADGSVRLRRMPNGELVATVPAEAVRAQSVTFNADDNWVAVTYENDMVRYWKVETGDLLLSINFYKSGGRLDWLAYAPNNFFDGTERSWEHLKWRHSDQPQTFGHAGLFFRDFFTLGLVRQALEGKSLIPVKQLSAIDRRQPKISLRFTPDNRNIFSKPDLVGEFATVAIELEEAKAEKDHPLGSGVQDVRLLRNDSLCHLWEGSVQLDKDGKSTLLITVPLVYGSNTLRAYCYNRDNVRSEEAKLTLDSFAEPNSNTVSPGRSNTKIRSGALRILSIGIDHFANSGVDLTYAAADAEEFASTFVSTQAAKYTRVETVTLINQRASKSAIIAALSELEGNINNEGNDGTKTGYRDTGSRSSTPVRPEDTVVIFLATHGGSYNSRYYLATSDFGRPTTAGGFSEAVKETMLSDVELTKALTKIDAKLIVLLIDACDSGRVIRGEKLTLPGPLNSKSFLELAYEKEIYIVAGAQAYRSAVEHGRLGHGLLAYCLLEGLTDPGADVAPKDGVTSLSEWLKFAVSRAREIGLSETDSAPSQVQIPVVYFRPNAKNASLSIHP